jgi:hypothetical protein
MKYFGGTPVINTLFCNEFRDKMHYNDGYIRFYELISQLMPEQIIWYERQEKRPVRVIFSERKIFLPAHITHLLMILLSSYSQKCFTLSHARYYISFYPSRRHICNE